MAPTRDFQRSALVPKPITRWRSRPPAGHEFAFAAARLAPPERKAMREIAEAADLVLVDGKPFLLAPVTDATIEALAAFEVEAADLEEDNEDTCRARDDYVGRPIGDGWLPGDPEDAEPDDVPEDDDPAGTDDHEDRGTPAPMSAQMRAIDADYLARQRQR